LRRFSEARHLDDQGVVRPEVYLHVGAPKTGTTYLQRVLDRNRALLREANVLYAPAEPDEPFRAAVDLRELPWGDQSHPQWAGTWQRLAERAAGWPGKSVISNELLAGATVDQIGEAVKSFDGAEVHIVYTLRSLGRMLPSDWQEQVKHRHAVTWEEYLQDVLDRGTASELGSWFWGLHDAPVVLARWAEVVPADRIHVICVAPKPTSSTALWQQFARVIGVPPGEYDASSGPANVSLGALETDFLQRVNGLTKGFVEHASYGPLVGELLIRGALRGRPDPMRVLVPGQRTQVVHERSAQVVRAISAAGYDVIGILDDLTDPRTSEAPDEPATVDMAMDLGADVATALLRRIGEQRDELAGLRDVLNRQREQIERLGSTPIEDLSDSEHIGRIRRSVRAISERHQSVMALRRRWWWAVERSRAGKEPESVD
jgi:hypothetical protein